MREKILIEITTIINHRCHTLNSSTEKIRDWISSSGLNMISRRNSKLSDLFCIVFFSATLSTQESILAIYLHISEATDESRRLSYSSLTMKYSRGTFPCGKRTVMAEAYNTS